MGSSGMVARASTRVPGTHGCKIIMYNTAALCRSVSVLTRVAFAYVFGKRMAPFAKLSRGAGDLNQPPAADLGEGG